MMKRRNLNHLTDVQKKGLGTNLRKEGKKRILKGVTSNMKQGRTKETK